MIGDCFWIGAQRNPLFFPGYAVLESPPLAPSRGNLKVEAFCVGELTGFGPGWALRIAVSVKGALEATFAAVTP